MLILSFIKAFLIGGILCILCQLIIDKTSITPARALVLFVCLGVLLGALGLYAPLVDFAGRGATVPLSGFGFCIYKGVREAIDEEGFSGIFTGALSAASGGTTAAMLFAFIASIFFRGKPK